MSGKFFEIYGKKSQIRILLLPWHILSPKFPIGFITILVLQVIHSLEVLNSVLAENRIFFTTTFIPTLRHTHLPTQWSTTEETAGTCT
jgi:hypothetical protein